MKLNNLKNIVIQKDINRIELICKKSNNIIGFINFEENENFIFVKNINVFKEYQKKWFGRLLIQLLQIRKKPLELIVLYPKVIGFYEKLKFKISWDIENYWFDYKNGPKSYLKELNLLEKFLNVKNKYLFV